MGNQSKLQDKQWLWKLAMNVRRRLSKLQPPESLSLTPAKRLRTTATTTDGWYIEIARFRRDRVGALQLWLDHYSDPSDRYRRLTICYKSTDVARLRRLGNAGTRAFGDPLVWKPLYVKRGPENFRLAEPLRKDQYDRPIVEIYPDRGDWSYYCIYRSTRPATERDPSDRLAVSICEAFYDIARAVDGLVPDHVGEFRQNVKTPVRGRHLRRERSSRLAADRKLKDGYTCQICNFNFAQAYGADGRGFAEAHHVETLSEQPVGRIISIDDLLTVCSNCHRMIHRLDGGRQAIRKLRRLVAQFQR